LDRDYICNATTGDEYHWECEYVKELAKKKEWTLKLEWMGQFEGWRIRVGGGRFGREIPADAVRGRGELSADGGADAR
jgi:hypothetical protein